MNYYDKVYGIHHFFSFVLVYLVGIFDLILKITYNPAIPKGISKRSLSKIGSEEEMVKELMRRMGL